MGDPHGADRRPPDQRYDRSLGPVRSALQLRLVLAVLGLLASITGLIVFTAVSSHVGWAVLFGVLVVVTVLDLAVISLRLSQRRHEGSKVESGRER